MAGERRLSDKRLREIRKGIEVGQMEMDEDEAFWAIRDLLDEVERLRKVSHETQEIVLSLAKAEVYHSDPDGFTFCGVCGSSQEVVGLIQHDDACPYLNALIFRGVRDEESDRHWTKHAEEELTAEQSAHLMEELEWVKRKEREMNY